jgi:hypothetical protein
MNQIPEMVLECVQQYMLVNGNKMPEHITFYRDGVGEGQFSLVKN